YGVAAWRRERQASCELLHLHNCAPWDVSRGTQFHGGSFNEIKGRLSWPSLPVPHQHAVVLACVKDKPCGGADAPSLNSAARAGALDRATGTKEWLRGG